MTPGTGAADDPEPAPPPSPSLHNLTPAILDDAHRLIAVDTAPLDRHPAAVYLARLSSGSRDAMLRSLHVIAGLLTQGKCDAWSLEWRAVRYHHSMMVRAVLEQKYAPATANKMLSALRGVLGEAWRLGQMEAHDYQRAVDVKAIKGKSLPAGRALSMGELHALFEACAEDRKPAGVRDAALIAVLYGAGLRRAEVVALNFADYSPQLGEIRVHRGKGRKARLCHTPPGCGLALDQWLEVRGTEPGPLFVPIGKGNRFHMRHLTPQAVLHILNERAKKARVAKFSPHDMRRTFIGDLLDAGADIASVQQMAGHANVQTTTRYDRRGEAVRKRAAALLHVPFIRIAIDQDVELQWRGASKTETREESEP